MRVRTGRGETKLQRGAFEAIELMGIPIERFQSGHFKVSGGGYVHCARKGTPDLWTALGLLEGKIPGEEPTDDQKAWHERARQWGARVEVYTSISHATDIVHKWREEFRHERAMGWR